MEKSKTDFTVKKTTTAKKSTKKPPVKEEDDDLDDINDQLRAALESVQADDVVNVEVDDDTPPFDIDESEDIFEEETDEMITLDAEKMSAIRASFKNADSVAKGEIKAILANYGGKLVAELRVSDAAKIEEILGLSDEV